MWYIKIGRKPKADAEAKRANEELASDETKALQERIETKALLERIETKALLERIVSALEGIDESLAQLAEDSYKERMAR